MLVCLKMRLREAQMLQETTFCGENDRQTRESKEYIKQDKSQLRIDFFFFLNQLYIELGTCSTTYHRTASPIMPQKNNNDWNTGEGSVWDNIKRGALQGVKEFVRDPGNSCLSVSYRQ